MNYVHNMPLEMKKKQVFCSACGEKLIPNPRTRILTYGDPAYKKFRRVGGVRLMGDIKLTEYDFKCVPCDKLISFDGQCVVSEIQKLLGKRILAQDELTDNLEKAKKAIEKKRKISFVINKIIVVLAIAVPLYFTLRSGECSFTVIF